MQRTCVIPRPALTWVRLNSLRPAITVTRCVPFGFLCSNRAIYAVPFLVICWLDHLPRYVGHPWQKLPHGTNINIYHRPRSVRRSQGFWKSGNHQILLWQFPPDRSTMGNVHTTRVTSPNHRRKRFNALSLFCQDTRRLLPWISSPRTIRSWSIKACFSRTHPHHPLTSTVIVS